ncbi:MAG: iron-sulfur cluster repair di-iron protein [Marinilabilia sp.]
MQLNENTIVGDVVRTSFKTAPLFEQNRIDFCCGGNISLKEASNKAGVDVQALIADLNSAMKEEDFDARFIESLSPDQLADYIEKRHHSYVKEKIPFIKQKLQKLCDVHGGNHPELFKISESFEEGAGNLSMHLMKEELVLFPMIRKLTKAKDGEAVDLKQFGDVQSPITVMLEEHQTEGDRFDTISELTNQYQTPEDGCETYEVTMKSLQDFEQDLHRHIHLENNILFPEAIKMEEELTGKQ